MDLLSEDVAKLDEISGAIDDFKLVTRVVLRFSLIIDNRDVYCFATTEAQSRQVGVDANVKNFPRHQIRIRILRGVCSPPELVGVAGSHRRTRVQIAEIKCKAHKKGLVEKI